MNYNRKSIRIKNYDYSRKGMYFITICTKDRKEILSKIIGTDDFICPENIKIQNSEIGNIIEKIWHHTEKIYDNIVMDEYIIMPNHIHGIIRINEGGQSRPPLQKIIQGFKSVTTRECFKYGIKQLWQRNYYEHIIRNEQEYYKIIKYIRENPIKYFYKKNII